MTKFLHASTAKAVRRKFVRQIFAHFSFSSIGGANALKEVAVNAYLPKVWQRNGAARRASRPQCRKAFLGVRTVSRMQRNT
jgi:hypothetical protein